MEEGRSVGLAQPARKPPRAADKSRPAGRGKASAPGDLREFMKLVSRTRWLGAGRGRGFKQKAGAWQDAIRGQKQEVAALVGSPSLEDATIAYLLWDKGSKRARAVGDRLLAAGMKSASLAEARAVYRVLTASGYPRAAELRPVAEALMLKPSRPESCKLWAEISAMR